MNNTSRFSEVGNSSSIFDDQQGLAQHLQRQVAEPQGEANNQQYEEDERDRQLQISHDERLARRLAHGFDDNDYDAFRDRWLAKCLGESNSDRVTVDELACRTEYTAALSAEHRALLGNEGSRSTPKRRRTAIASTTAGDVVDLTDTPQQEEERRRRPSLECLTCSETKPAEQVITVSCGHHICDTCTITLFEGAMRDETLFPPRCCRTHEILLYDARPLLGQDLAARFDEKAIELRTQDRTYCHVPRCSAFIRPDAIFSNVSRCPTCRARTCALCKGPSHTGEDCPLDGGRQQVEQFARENGWRQCGGCRRMVELNYGCYHMTCICGHNFCYLCGVEWKNCPCTQWQEERLYERANAVANRPRAGPLRLVGGPPRRPNHDNGDNNGEHRRDERMAIDAIIGGPRDGEGRRRHHDEPYGRVRDEADANMFELRARRILHLGEPPQDTHEQHRDDGLDLTARRRRPEQLAPRRTPSPPPARHQQVRPAAPPAPLDVQDIAEHLRENHECDHAGRWRRFHHGRNACEIFGKVKANPAVGECPRCFLQACYYCRKRRMR